MVSIHTLISGEGWRPPCPPQNYHVSVGVYLEAFLFSPPVPYLKRPVPVMEKLTLPCITTYVALRRAPRRQRGLGILSFLRVLNRKPIYETLRVSQ